MLRICEDHLGPNQQPRPGHDVSRDHVRLQGGLSRGQCSGPAPNHSLCDLRSLKITINKQAYICHSFMRFAFKRLCFENSLVLWKKNHRNRKTRFSVVKNIFVFSWFVYREKRKTWSDKNHCHYGVRRKWQETGPLLSISARRICRNRAEWVIFWNSWMGWQGTTPHSSIQCIRFLRTKLPAWPPRPRQWRPLAGGSSWSPATFSSLALTWSGSRSPWLTTFCFPTIMRRQKVLPI